MLRFRLALALGCTVRDLTKRLEFTEWLHWKALWNLDPWGEQREDERAAMITAAILATKGSRKKVADFRLYPDDRFIPQEDLWDAILDRASRRSMANRR